MPSNQDFPVFTVLLFSITAVSGFLFIYGLIMMRKHRQAVPGASMQEIVDSSSPFSRVAGLIISDSIEKGADSVILRQQGDELIVENRFGDEIRNMMCPPLHLKIPLTARFKYLAGVDYTKNEPVRKSFFYEHNGEKIELELITSLNNFGEQVEIIIKAG
ncbi:MAG: hypothetical protein LWY06_14005 [Firmicutes bacterium]|nr:hypothetical protein [Bacillota bacterium]